MRKLTKDGNEITDLSIINNELKQFYKNPYSRKSLMTEEQCMDYLSEVSTPSLAKEEAEICEGKLTLQECLTALNQIPGNKSPGNDALTKEFLLCFFRNIGSPLVESINQSSEVGELSSSQKQAMIVLIGKKDSDKRLVKNWRPISLLNVDTKILSKELLDILGKKGCPILLISILL